MERNELFGNAKTILLDGGMGTMLQAAGMPAGTVPESLNLEDPAMVEGIQAQYAAAGSRILNANTFGASARKLAGTPYTPEQVIPAGIAIAKKAAKPYGALVALDIGPLGELLEPAGTLTLEQAVAEFSREVRAGAAADLIVLETFTDLYELKAALLAAKENSALPVIASMSFEPNGRTFTGCTVESFAAVARGLGADAVGINCSLGPAEIFPLAQRLAAAVPADFPVFVKPNAGLPRADGSGYDITPQTFAYQMRAYRGLGLWAAGGCCGTTPEFIRLLGSTFADCAPGRPAQTEPPVGVLCTPVNCVAVNGPVVVGERINPTGKKRLRQAILDGDMDYILALAVQQAEAGAAVLDVNMGAPGADEPLCMERAVRAIQSVCDLPLQLDSSDPEALARGLRVYNGKPIVNSVNAGAESLRTILPLCKKYGAAVIGLTLDEAGIPGAAEDRVALACRIRDAALAAGIPQEDIYIDCLTLTASAQQQDVLETLKALRRCKELGLHTALGVSNVSFGLPCRDTLNAAFFALALGAGLDLAIINPGSEAMAGALAAWRVLSGADARCADYVARYAGQNTQPAPAAEKAGDPVSALKMAVERGLRGEAATAARALLETKTPLAVVDEALVPALDAVGAGYEAGTLFLPQLLQAAAAAQSAFAVLREALAQSGAAQGGKGGIVLATVQGDVHDIGKNIVRVLLENYGFDVLDLGRDVPSQRVVQAVQKTGARLVGLSALMTTTLPAMEKTIALVHAECPGVAVMVGGAVLTPQYARTIGADYYAKDAKESADIARAFYGAAAEKGE